MNRTVSTKGIIYTMTTRTSGILLHPTSLPGRYGIGDLGEYAYRFIDYLVETDQSVWQVLPLGPTGYGDSPYQSPSTFAGNSNLISLDMLVCRWLPERPRLWPTCRTSRQYHSRLRLDHPLSQGKAGTGLLTL
jgi:4-alpha-glucanotransferase